MVVSLISVMDANQLMFIYLQQPNVTFENNQNDGFCQFVTHNTLSPQLKQEPFKMVKDGPFPSITPTPPPFPSFWSRPVSGCETILTVGCHLLSSPEQVALSTAEGSLWRYILSSGCPKNGHTGRCNKSL